MANRNMQQTAMQSSNSPQPATTESPAPELSPANKDSPAPPQQQQQSPAAEQGEGAGEGSEDAPQEMTLDITSFRKPGEKTFTQRSRLFVGNLPVDIPEEEFRKMFAKYGNINEVFINRERGFGFVCLETRTLAEIAKAELDGTVLKNRPIRIRFATHNSALTIRNLLPAVTNELLEQAFSQFGLVERAVVITDDRGRPTGKGIVEFANKQAARKALERCTEGALLLTNTPCPAIVEPAEHLDEEDGLPEKLMLKTPKYHKEREHPPHFAQPGTFEFEYSSRWKALYEMEKQQREQVDRNIREAKEKLEAELESAKHEHQLMLMRHDLMRRQEELRRLEELRNQELQRRKQIEMRHEEERRRREEEMLRHREQQEDMRRHPEGFKPNYLDNREQEMRGAELGPRGAVNMGDGFNQGSPGPSANQGQMMGASGRGGPVGQEGNANIGTPLMPENGGMRNDRYPQGASVEGRPQAESPKQQQQQQQQALGAQVGQAGFGRGGPVGSVFDGPNNKRRRF